MVTLEYPLPTTRADVWMAARLGLRGALVMTAGWTTLALLAVTLAADRFVWSVPAFVCSAVVLLPKVVSGKTIEAPGAGLLLPDGFTRRLPPLPSRLDIVDMAQILGHARWSVLPAE